MGLSTGTFLRFDRSLEVLIPAATADLPRAGGVLEERKRDTLLAPSN